MKGIFKMSFKRHQQNLQVKSQKTEFCSIPECPTKLKKQGSSYDSFIKPAALSANI